MTANRIGLVVSRNLIDSRAAREPRPADPAAQVRRRQVHAHKTAWFVRHGFREPLGLDVGTPALGCNVLHIVQDGNHRLASAIYRLQLRGEDALLPVLVSGDMAYARALGLCADLPSVPATAPVR